MGYSAYYALSHSKVCDSIVLCLKLNPASWCFVVHMLWPDACMNTGKVVDLDGLRLSKTIW